MKWFLRSWSYVANPIFVPALVSLWYFLEVSMSDPAIMRTKMYLILILTAAIPILLFIVLKLLRAVTSIHLSEVRERITPLISYCILLIILIRSVFRDDMHQPLYYFFIGTIMASFVSLALAVIRYKVSLHMLAAGGALGFVLLISVKLGMPMLYSIMVLIMVSGVTASSRLYMKAHQGHELWFGMGIGLLSQIVVGSYYVL